MLNFSFVQRKTRQALEREGEPSFLPAPQALLRQHTQLRQSQHN